MIRFLSILDEAYDVESVCLAVDDAFSLRGRTQNYGYKGRGKAIDQVNRRLPVGQIGIVGNSFGVHGEKFFRQVIIITIGTQSPAG